MLGYPLPYVLHCLALCCVCCRALFNACVGKQSCFIWATHAVLGDTRSWGAPSWGKPILKFFSA